MAFRMSSCAACGKLRQATSRDSTLRTYPLKAIGAGFDGYAEKTLRVSSTCLVRVNYSATVRRPNGQTGSFPCG